MVAESSRDAIEPGAELLTAFISAAGMMRDNPPPRAGQGAMRRLVVSACRTCASELAAFLKRHLPVTHDAGA